ncbi:MAG: NAD(P)H-dependent oxidoreductase [Desulfobacteraceae bacterium]|jgi:putative NADPH-quinone reductase
MKILVVLAHPDPDSFNHAITHEVCDALQGEGHKIILHDLYGESFDPLLTKEEIPKKGLVADVIQQHCNELQSADGIIIVHPNWWGQPPAVLKGWIDRVIRPNVAYRFEEEDSGEGVPIGLLKAQAVLVFNTSNTPFEREQAVFGDPLEILWKNCIFDLCGVHNFHRRMFSVVVTSTDAQRKTWLNEARALALELFESSHIH